MRSTSDDDKPAGVAASSVPDADAVSPVMEPDPEPTYVEVDADGFSNDLRTASATVLRVSGLQHDRGTGDHLSGQQWGSVTSPGR